MKQSVHDSGRFYVIFLSTVMSNITSISDAVLVDYQCHDGWH